MLADVRPDADCKSMYGNRNPIQKARDPSPNHLLEPNRILLHWRISTHDERSRSPQIGQLLVNPVPESRKGSL